MAKKQILQSEFFTPEKIEEKLKSLKQGEILFRLIGARDVLGKIDCGERAGENRVTVFAGSKLKPRVDRVDKEKKFKDDIARKRATKKISRNTNGEEILEEDSEFPTINQAAEFICMNTVSGYNAAQYYIGKKEENYVDSNWVNGVAAKEAGYNVTEQNVQTNKKSDSAKKTIKKGKNHGSGKNLEIPLNLILYGPPGTGKTYHTVMYAEAICNKKLSIPNSVTETEYDAILDEYNQLKANGRIEFVTFHQSYGYEEFIQGIKPSTDKGNVVYNVENGIFKKFCDKADSDEERKPYVFIIDEINRGNVSKIFGELITLIEDSKRIGVDKNGKAKGMKATLPYEKTDEEGNKVKVEFGVPDNVYILGTMNTADRSLVQLDAALRRRFRFKEMMPNYDLLQQKTVGVINLADLLQAINKRITARIDREHQIGHSYFLKVNDLEGLKDVFHYEIIPLLQEYFYDDYANIKEVLKDAQDDFISVEDYDGSKLYEIGDSDKWTEDDFKNIY